jgi:cell division protein FtsZ
MDRRTFIQSLPCLGATTTLPAFAFSGGTRPPTILEAATTPAKSESLSEPRIGVIAVGGAGGTILSELYGKLPYLSHSTAIDIDSDALQRVAANRKILIGDATVRPRDARTASLLANDARAQIADAVADLDIAFIVAGMGGVAGTAISPLVAEILRKNQVMTIAAAFTPVNSEGPRQHHIAVDGMLALGDIANATFRISNDVLCWHACQRDLPLWSSPATTTFERLYRSIAEPIASPDQWVVRWDTQDIRECMSSEGSAAIGYGTASGRNAAEEATRKAIHHPLLGEDQLSTASCVLVLIESAPELLRLRQLVEISHLIREFLSVSTAVADPYYLYGAIWSKAMADSFRVTILASGIRSI